MKVAQRGMSQLNRLVAVLVAAVITVAIVITGEPRAQADQLSDAKAKLASLQEEASQAEEQYNQIQASLDAAQAKLTQTQADIASQKEQVDAMREQVAILTLEQFRDRGITSTAALLTGGDQDQTLERIIMSSMVTDTTTALLQNYQLSQATLSDLEKEQQASVDSITADQQRQQDLKDQADQKVQQTQTVIKRLTAEQQIALGVSSTSSSSYSPPPPVQNGAAAQTIVNFAMSHVGGAYAYGGVGPAYDCSGFTMAAYKLVGIDLPHSATSQFRYGTPVAPADLQPGDLVFYYSGPGHVAIYVGGGMLVDARNVSLGIVYRPLDTGSTFAGARRLL